MSFDVDCAVIGGGAAGCAAAVFLGRAAARQGISRRLLLLEKAPRVGKKLLATGNGTCNLSNVSATAARYHGCPALAGAALAAFPPAAARRFFGSIGVDTCERPDGKVYPESEQAGAVLDALRLEAAACGVETRCNCAVEALQPIKGGWRLETTAGSLTAQQVLVCTGGAAAPALGGSADAYRLLTALGLERTPLFPSIVQLRTEPTLVRAVKGIRTQARVWLTLEGQLLAENTGELLFTDYGLSGPVVMQISRPAADWERRKKGALTAHLNLLPHWQPDRLQQRVEERAALPGRTLEDLLTGLLHKRLGQTVLRAAGVLPLTRPVGELTPAECCRIAAWIQDWPLPVTGTQGFGGAQVTAGGIAAERIDHRTMAVRGFSGLYAAGEVLDVDGDCGGYNLQFAWSSAFVAARAMAEHWSAARKG